MKHSSIPAVRAAALAALLGFCLCAFGCGKDDRHEREFFAMDTFMQLRAYGEGAENALDEAEKAILELSSLLSVTDVNSEVFAINKGGEAAVSPETYRVISRALELSLEAGSPFELTVYPVLRAWGFTTGEYRVPSDDELSGLLALVDDSKVELDPDNRTVRLPEGCMLDLGAAAKGCAAELAAAIMRDNGVEHALLDLGSSTIRTVGAKPDGSGWSIAIRDPVDSSAYAGAILMEEGSVSTSGGYERCFKAEDGRVYGHIIDPATGRPVDNGVLSVTVLCADAFLGDVLSTALYVMGLEGAVSFRSEHGGFEFIMITEEGIFLTPGAKQAFTPLGNYSAADITVIGNED